MPIQLKGCQRCGGDLVHSADSYGAYLQCLQCGRFPLEIVPRLPQMKMVRNRKRAEYADGTSSHKRGRQWVEV